jgi:hypothetical protein
VTNAWPFGEGAAPGRGKLSTPLPTPGLAEGRTSDTKPASILRIGGQGNVSRGYEAALRNPLGDGLPRTRRKAHCAAALYAGTPAWNGGWRSTFPHRTLRTDAG